MTFTTRGDKQSMDPPMMSSVEDEKRGGNEAEEVSVELVDKSEKEAETPQKVTPLLDHNLNFSKNW